MQRPLLHIEPDYAIARKVQLLQDFLGEHYFDDGGLMYSNWYWKGDELRPCRRRDFANQSVFTNADGLDP